MGWTGTSRKQKAGGAAWPALGLVLLSASCVPAGVETRMPIALAAQDASAAAEAIGDTAAPPPPDAAPLDAPTLVGEQAMLANAALPLAGAAGPASAPFLVRAHSGLDRLRSHDCLAQAVYYEAASESEEGQRAVAQVVLNRVRHPSWPNSVCGVVYQGPMRAGGGCQFTFTCDGSLLRRPGGTSWARAQRIAEEALAGRVFAPVGLSTHYHANYVLPAWAPRLAKTAEIGAHLFYRVPGRWGAPAAFTQAYAGVEPIPRPAMTMLRRPTPGTGLAELTTPQPLTPNPRAVAAPVALPSVPLAPAPAPSTDESRIREEYRHSGQWRADSPIQPAR